MNVAAQLPKFEGLRGERVGASPQFDRETGRFRNRARLAEPRPSIGTILEFFRGSADREPKTPLPVVDPRAGWSRPCGAGVRTTWLGHSSVLLELETVKGKRLRVLTDPVFGERASPVPFAGPRRFHEVPLVAAAIPVDVVLLSHDHYDHLCAETIASFAAREIPIVTSLGVGARLESLGVRRGKITELDWDENVSLFGGEIRFRALPCQHFSGRSIGDRNKTLWSSFVVETANHKVFFSGDTGLFPEMEALAKFGPFDLVMLEVGAFHPSWGTIHLGPENALEAHKLLGGGPLLPVHWATFNLGLHPWREPGEVLFGHYESRDLPLLFPQIGEPFEPLDLLDGRQKAWWRDPALR